MSKPTKLPVDRRKPIGRSITSKDISNLVKSASARKQEALADKAKTTKIPKNE